MVMTPVIALVVAACSTASGAPAYTYPSPSSPPASSPMNVGPSESPMAMPSTPTPSTPPSAAPDATGSAPPASATQHIAAQNIQFDTDHLAAPAGQGWVLVFDNNDPGVPHNVEILDHTGTSVFRGDVVTGPTTVSYRVPALAAGTYKFFCDVHPTMTGTLTVR
jgi:plastocyanin